MPRFELGADTWEIEQVGKSLVITAGNKQTTRKFVSEAAAAVQYKVLVAAQKRAGFRPARPMVPETTRHPDLEQAILDDPYDVEAYSVYADWLQRQNDPWGKLIALHVARARNPRDDKLDAAARELFAAHADHFLGPLAEYDKPSVADLETTFTWRFGFIHRLRIDDRLQSLHQQGDPVELLRRVLAHPAGRFLVELSIHHDRDVRLLQLLAERAPASLRGLELVTDPGDLAAVWRAAPRLRRVVVKTMSGMSAACLRSIATARLPELERLEIRDSMSPHADPVGIEDIRLLLQRTDLPKLVNLRLRGSPLADSLCHELVTSPLASQLVVLDLALARYQTGLALLVKHHARFPRLRELWVSRKMFSADQLRALEGAFERIVDVVIDPDDIVISPAILRHQKQIRRRR